MLHISLFLTAFLAGALALRAAQDAFDRIHDWTIAARVSLSLLVVHFMVWFLYA